MSKRFKLRRSPSKQLPRRMVFVDTETLPDPTWEGQPKWTEFDAELHKLRLGCALYVELVDGVETMREWFDFTTCQQWWDWLYAKGHRDGALWVFAHNCGFDSTVLGLWGEIDNGHQRIPVRYKDEDGELVEVGTCCVLDDPPTIVELTDPAGRRFRWIDTLNYWRMSLTSLGDSLKVPKLDMPDWEASDEAWFTYCRRDVEVIAQAIVGLVRWVKDNELGKFRFTAPSLAMGCYRHRFLQREIIFHQEQAVRELERRAYYGGQVEIYRHGKRRRKVHQLDVTSLYPSVMLDGLFPYRLETQSDDVDGYTCEPWDMGLCGVADVLIDTIDRSYPKRWEGKTIYPIGEYWTSLCGPELKHAFDNGHIKRFGRWSLYKIDRLFTDYVNFFWELRREAKLSGNVLYDLLCKLMLNSLYGKFGQRGSEWVFDPTVVPERPWARWEAIYADTGESVTYHALGYQVRRKEQRGEYDKAFPAIAGFCTSYARERMRALRETAGRDNVYYQAVDALYVTQEGFDRLCDAGEIGDKELGKLQHETSGCPCDFRNINNYSLGTKTIIGSVKRCKECQGKGSVEGVRCLICGGLGVPRPNTDGKYPQLQFEHLASILTHEPLRGVVIQRTAKRVKMDYDRGTIAQDGWVKPLEFADNAWLGF